MLFESASKVVSNFGSLHLTETLILQGKSPRSVSACEGFLIHEKVLLATVLALQSA
jgi:hypothetical protein